MAEPDVGRIRENLSKMIDQGAPEADLHAYAQSEGVTMDQVAGRAGGGGPQAEISQGQPEPYGAAIARGLRKQTGQPQWVGDRLYFPKAQQRTSGVVLGEGIRDVTTSAAGSAGIALGARTGSPLVSAGLGGFFSGAADIALDHTASLLEWANNVPNGEHRSMLQRAIAPVTVGLLNAMGATASGGAAELRKPLVEDLGALRKPLPEEVLAERTAAQAKQAQLGVLKYQDRVAAIAEKAGALNKTAQESQAASETLTGIAEAQPGKAVISELSQKAQAANEASISPLGDSLINQSRWHGAGRDTGETYVGSGTDYLLGSNVDASGKVVPATTKFAQQRAAAAVGFEKVASSYGKGGKFQAANLTNSYQSQLRSGLPMVRTYEQAGATNLPAYLELQNAGGNLTMPQAMLKLQEMGANYARLSPGIEQKALAENMSALSGDIHDALMKKDPRLAFDFSRSKALWRDGIEAASQLAPIVNAKSSVEARQAALKLFNNPVAVKAMYDTYNPKLYAAIAFEKAKEVLNPPTAMALKAYADMPMISRQGMFGAPLTSEAGVKLAPGMNPQAPNQLQTVGNMALEAQGAPSEAMQQRQGMIQDRLDMARLDVVHANEEAKTLADKAELARINAEEASKRIVADKKAQATSNAMDILGGGLFRGTTKAILRDLGSILPDKQTAPAAYAKLMRGIQSIDVNNMNSVATFVANIPDPAVRNYLMARFSVEHDVATKAAEQKR